MQRRYAAENPHDFNELGLLQNSYFMPPIAIAVAATRKSQNRQPPPAHLFFQVARMFGRVLMCFVFQHDEQAGFQDDAGGRSTMNSLPP